MTAALTHTTATFGGAKPASSKPASSSWAARLLVALGSLVELLAEVREEERKAHARYPHLVEW